MANTISTQITEKLNLIEQLDKAMRNLDGVCCPNEDCDWEPHCSHCARLAHAMERLEKRYNHETALLDELAAEAEQEEMRLADIDERIQCEYCGGPLHPEHLCAGLRAESMEAAAFEEHYR